jgi:hypothetical protein
VDGDETNDDRKDTFASLTCISLQWPEKKQTEEAGKKREKQKGKAIETDLRKKERKSGG